MFCPCFVMYYCVLYHLDGERRSGSFTLSVFLMSCDNQRSVALSHGAVGIPVSKSQ